MVNSSWTQAHINSLLGVAPTSSICSKSASIVYPPCDTNVLSKLSLKNREKIILSVAQFRPEKEHATQLRALKCYIDLEDSERTDGVRLILAGSVRNTGDEARVASLRRLADDLQIEASQACSPTRGGCAEPESEYRIK
jgi:alpha-1,2-mannosyltransferase